MTRFGKLSRQLQRLTPDRVQPLPTPHGAVLSGYQAPIPFLGLINIMGDSNAAGQANFQATNGGDLGYGISNTSGFVGCTMNQQVSQSVNDPVPWTFTPTQTLRARAAPPAANMGDEQSLGRYLFNYGVCAAPIITSFGAAGATFAHWAVDSTFPITAGNIYSQWITYMLAREAEFGRKHDAVIMRMGENDITQQALADNYQARMSALMAQARVDLNNPGLLFLVAQLNIATTGTYSAQIRAAQAAAVAADKRAILFSTDDIVPTANPHFDAIGHIGQGEREAVILKNYFQSPQRSVNLGVGPEPWYQQADAGRPGGATCLPRSGPDPQEGDFEILVATSYSTAPSITLADPQGFTQIIAPFESIFSGTIHRGMAVWGRVLTAGMIANYTTSKPTVTFGATTSNVTRIFGFRGPNKWVSSPVVASASGVNNNNNTSLSIPGGDTTGHPNCLVVLFNTIVNSNNHLVSITNVDLSNISTKWDALYNEPSVVGLVMTTAKKAAAGVFGSTAVTIFSAGCNAGAMVAIAP